MNDNILIDFTPLINGQSGIAHDLISITKCFQQLENYKLAGFIKCFNEKGDIEKLNNILNKNNIYLSEIVTVKSSRIIEKIKALLGIHSYTLIKNNFKYLFAQVDTNVKVNSNTNIILRIHDVITLTNPEFVNNHFLNSIILKNLTKSVLKQNPHIVFNSNYSKNQFFKYFEEKNVKSSVIGCIAEVKENTSLSSIVPNGKYITFCGSIEPKKNIKLIINAFEKCLKDYPNLELLIIGRYGWKSEWFLKSITNLKNVKWMNNTSDEERDILIKNSSCFVFPSIIEGFGMPAIEAMQLKIPVIVSDIEIFKELHLNHSLKVNPMDDEELYRKIKYVLKDENKEEINKMVLDAFVWSKRYTHNQIFILWQLLLKS